MKLCRWIAMVLTLAVFAGCGQQTVQEGRLDAQKRWCHTRAQMLYGVGAEHLKAGQLDQARNKAAEALTLDEEYVQARVLLAKVYIEQGSYSQATGELERVIKAMPKSSEAVYLLGVAQEKDGRLEQALESYRLAYAMDGKNMPAIVAAGEVLVAMGQVREAQLHVESYLRQAGDDPSMYELAGRVSMMQEYDKAVEHFQQAHDLDYKNVLYLESLGTAQFFAGKYQQAAQTLEAVIETKDRAAGASIYMKLGECYLAIDRPKDARDAFVKVCEAAPKDSAAWTGLAKAAMALGDNPRAIASARKALDLEADQTEAVLVLGYVLTKEGKTDQAIAVLKRASQKQDNPMLLCLLGRAYSAGGDQAQAIRCYTDALKIDPDNSLAQELLK